MIKKKNLVEFTCPFCGETFAFYDNFIKSFSDIENCTCDCPGCNKLLLVREGRFVDAIATFREDARKEGYTFEKESFRWISI